MMRGPVSAFADRVTALKRAILICSATESVIPPASMIAMTRMAVVVTILIAARAAWAGPAAIVPCCFPDGTCREDLSPVECESSGADFPIASTCADPNPCIVCCRSGDPVSCEDHVTFRNCVTRPNLMQYISRAVCGSDGQCVTIQGGDCTDAAQCATGFCADGVCCDTACTSPDTACNLPGQRGTCTDVARAPALTPGALVLLAALLFGGAVFALRRGI